MSARAPIRNVCQSPTNGSAIVGAELTITKHEPGASELGKGEAATIYKSETGSETAPTNTIKSDSKGTFTQGSPGFAEYWLPVGRYDLKLGGPGLTSYYVVSDFLSAAEHGIPSELLTESVALTGNPTAPEQAESDNSTKLATTSFVTRAINAIKSSLEVAKLKVTGTLELPGESITEAMIKALAVTTAKLANEAVTAAKLGPEAITDAKVVKGRALVETENSWSGLKGVTGEELAEGISPSSSRFAFVILRISGSGPETILLKVGGKAYNIKETGGKNEVGPIPVPAGQKLVAEDITGTGHEWQYLLI